MSLFKEMKSRQIQRKANSFIESLKKKKNESEIEVAYLNNKELENNEIVLSYLFFNHPSLIRILPKDFQKSRINSNLNMFEYGSNEAKKALISDWINNNKFFTNALAMGMSESEYEEYLKVYFKQPNDIALLYMEDLKKAIEILSKIDLKQTEDILAKIKDKLNTRQWEYIIKVNPSFIKYANNETQNAHADEEEFVTFLSGEARGKYINSQLDLIKNDLSLLETMDTDIQIEYVKKHPYMLNYLSDEIVINVLKYDINLIKYVNLSISKNKKDKTQEVVCSILDSIENKTNKEIVNILVNKCLLNAKGKLYRFDPKSNDISYQYTKRVIKAMQNLSINQIITLIMIDVNYVLPYIVPVYNDNESKEEKEKIVLDANSRCLNVFKSYFGEKYYSKYYKNINKIYSEFLSNMDKYDYSKDYRSIFDLFKVLFNKEIIESNNPEKVSVFIGTSLLHKSSDKNEVKVTSVKLLNELLESAYNKKIDNNKEIFNISSLELFDDRLSFIDKNLLDDFFQYNFVNISNLLLIIKSERIYDLFKMYYNIIVDIYGENKESLYRAIENFSYYKNILRSVKDENLKDEELNNLTILLTTFFNTNDINKKEELEDYDIMALKKLVLQLSAVKDENIYKNILCNYLFNKGYDERGNTGWLECDTIKELCEIYDSDSLKTLEVDGKKVFDSEEVKLFSMIKLLFSVNDFDLLFQFLEKIIEGKITRNILSTIELFNKIKKYRVALINNQIVTISDIENLYIDRPDMVIKSKKDGIDVYTVVGQDFRILCSLNDDKIHYDCVNATSLDKNVYAYDYLANEGSVRFVNVDNNIIIKLNKDSYNNSKMVPTYIVVVGQLNDDLISIAKENNLKIVELQSE